MLATLVAGCGNTRSAEVVIVEEPVNAVRSLQVLPQVVDLGLVPAGSRREVFIEVKNHTDRDITVGQLQMSCECLLPTLQRATLRPGESVRGRIAFDLAEIPEFNGRLDMSISTDGADDSWHFRCRVLADVRPRGEFEGLQVTAVSTEPPVIECLLPVPDRAPSPPPAGVTR
jgi:hypothetical protein